MNHEHSWDKLLQIHTCGRDDTHADQYHHPYEPTPYSVLERLAAVSSRLELLEKLADLSKLFGYANPMNTFTSALWKTAKPPSPG